jgi:hypothetical protein
MARCFGRRLPDGHRTCLRAVRLDVAATQKSEWGQVTRRNLQALHLTDEDGVIAAIMHLDDLTLEERQVG